MTDNDPLAAAREALAQGEPSRAVLSLRPAADGLPLPGLVALVRDASRALGADGLAAAADALLDDTDGPKALYDFGYAAIEAGIPFVAVPALRRARGLAPDVLPILWELASALEDGHRHAEAADALRGWAGELPDWPGRYLIAFNSLAAGDLAGAGEALAGLPAPRDPDWEPARARVQAMADRAGAAAQAGPLDGSDLRGWHFALHGGVVAHLSPFGFEEPMRGRYAFVSDDYSYCRTGLERLRLVLEAAGRAPEGVMALPDRDSTVLGLAASRLLGLPLLPVDPARPGALVVAYDLDAADPELRAALFERPDGQILFEHAAGWVRPSGPAADVVTLLHQTAHRPWGERMRVADPQNPGGGVETVPADERPEAELAEEVLAAEPVTGENGEDGPPDTVDVLTGFTGAVAGHWARGARRWRADTPGPVRSAYFG
ncbi:hypothetical protein SUDANB121_03081 [Nocardiopsis dassonvillei]|uniref:hypothetical protein n=1 Tax=Nocardiopsis dassonvillei TaxID=2014 RepID=UPI003F57A4D5